MSQKLKISNESIPMLGVPHQKIVWNYGSPIVSGRGHAFNHSLPKLNLEPIKSVDITSWTKIP